MRFIILGLLIMALAGGFFWFMVISDMQPVAIDQAEAHRRITQVAGGVGGLGAVLFLMGLLQKLRGN